MERDKREYIRIEASLNFCYRVYRRTEIAGDISQIRDISLGGAKITSKHELNVDDILELTFRTPQSKNKITILGRVLECYKIIEESIYVSRVSFSYPHKDSQAMMSQLIQEIKSV